MSHYQSQYHHLTWFSIALRFLGLLTTVSCSSAIFFIFPSMSIFCSRPRTWPRSRRTVSSFPWRLANSEALAEWMAVTQFSRSVWLLAWKGKEGQGDEVAGPIFPITSWIHMWQLINLLALPKHGYCVILSYITMRSLGGKPGLAGSIRENLINGASLRKHRLWTVVEITHIFPVNNTIITL